MYLTPFRHASLSTALGGIAEESLGEIAMPRTLGCPTSQQLKLLVLGKLSDQQSEQLEEHLRSCLRCGQIVNTLKDDHSLAKILRDSQGVESEENSLVSSLIDRLQNLKKTTGPSSQKISSSEVGTLDVSRLRPPQKTGEIGRLGGYRILDVLGSGGMGTVFRAEDEQLQRQVALKIMRPEAAGKPAAGERFLREARATAALKNDHIVTIYQVGEDHGVLFLAMELLEGESLKEWMERNPRPNADEILRIGIEITHGLEAAHKKGLVHRDLKPGNIWLEGSTNRVKILDFGMARLLEEVSPLTQSGVILGTPLYMSPEQARGEPADTRSDLFSLGCILYRLCAGVEPFQGTTSYAILTALATETPRPVREFNPDTPESLAKLIMQLLLKNRAERPAIAREVTLSLQVIQRNWKGNTQTAPKSILSLPPAPQNRTARPRWLWITALASVVLILGFSAWKLGFLTLHGDSDGKHQANDLNEPIAKTQSGKRSENRNSAHIPFPKNSSLAEKKNWVLKELERRNPGFVGKNATLKLSEEGLTFHAESQQSLHDPTPLSALSALKGIDVSRTQVSSLQAFANLDLYWLDCGGCSQITSLDPLRNMPLTNVSIWGTGVQDLSPLAGRRLDYLDCHDTEVNQLSPLKGIPLVELNVGGTKVKDLSPLKFSTSLRYLDCSNTAVSRLSALKGIPLEELWISNTQIKDLSPLKSMTSLQSLNCGEYLVREAEWLTQLPALKKINNQPIPRFRKQRD